MSDADEIPALDAPVQLILDGLEPIMDARWGDADTKPPPSLPVTPHRLAGRRVIGVQQLSGPGHGKYKRSAFAENWTRIVRQQLELDLPDPADNAPYLRQQLEAKQPIGPAFAAEDDAALLIGIPYGFWQPWDAGPPGRTPGTHLIPDMETGWAQGKNTAPAKVAITRVDGVTLYAGRCYRLDGQSWWPATPAKARHRLPPQDRRIPGSHWLPLPSPMEARST
jgi:hypothetical protein